MLEKGHKPLFYISPGFFFDSPEDEWFKLNIKLMELAAEKSLEQKTYGYLPISKNCFDHTYIDEIADRIPNKINGVVVWFEDFEDTFANENELRFVAQMVKSLSERGLNIINLYGGFFSVLLSEIGLQGYSSGLCYDTSRNREIVPTGGPVPLRYYIPEINRLMRQLDVEGFYKYIKPSCECNICEEKMKNSVDNKTGELQIDSFVDSLFSYDKNKRGDYQIYEDALKEHFMRSVKNQMEKLKIKGVKKFLEEKQQIHDELVKIYGPYIANKYASHIPKWINVINELV